MSAKCKSMCSGCREDFYNGQNSLGVKECWSFKDAEVVKRFRQGWWDDPTKPGAFREVVTLDCHRAPGKYAHRSVLPDWAVDPVRLSKVEAES